MCFNFFGIFFLIHFKQHQSKDCVLPFSFCSCPCAGYWAASANKSDPPANSRTVFLHKTNPWNSNGRDSSFWLHLHSAFLYSQQHLVRPLECCQTWLVWLSCFASAGVAWSPPFLCLSGLIRCTTCLASSFWFSSFCSSRAPRPQFCSVTSISVLRCLSFCCHFLKCNLE